MEEKRGKAAKAAKALRMHGRIREALAILAIAIPSECGFYILF
jgi:hypothetical protein